MELLSPAGNLECALAAFDGGADAVYCGLGRFNARERAENFTPETLGKLLEFAHLSNKKVYVTLNTLVWESELGALFEEILQLDRLRPDALIVQDPGVIAIIRQYFPDLPLHASTQMGIHNSAGVKAAARLGFKRVIMERQISLDELRTVAAASPVELEVFLHGSLCCSLSGRCLLSHYLYGESGNRGRCKQPCRRAFFRPGSCDESSRIISPADLAGSSLLDELRKIKIASLKIEGRLRTPDYIWKSARAYRILLDNPGDKDAAKEAEKIFKTIPGRKKSTGFYFKRDWKKLIDPEASGTFGESCAVVEKAIRSGILVKVKSSLHLGDRLRLIPANGGEGTTFTLSTMEDHLRRRIIRARAGEKVFIAGTFRAAPGHDLRRIGENGFDFSRRAEALPEFKRKIDLNLSACANLFYAEIPGISARWSKECRFADAEKRPLTAETLEKVFSESLPDGFTTGKINVKIDGNFFVPAAELKKMRRECWLYFAGFLQKHDFFPEHSRKMEEFYRDVNREHLHFPLPAAPRGTIYHIPAFIAENELPAEKQRIANAIASGNKNFSVSHWHGFELLRDFPDIKLHVRYPFHISNSFALKLAAALGASSASITPECDPENSELLIAHAVIPTGKDDRIPPLLATRIPLPSGIWQLNDHLFKISGRQQDGLFLLHSHEPTEISG